jgi:hypothetical protein
LLQFRDICKEKPDNLPPLDVIGLEPGDAPSLTMSRGGSGRRRAPSGMLVPVNVRSASIGLGIASGLGKSPGIGFQMGKFSTSAKMTSEECFKEEAKRAEKERKEAEERASREEREPKEAEEEALKAAEAARVLADADAKPDSLPEEGEIVDEVSQPTTAEEILPTKPASVSSPSAPTDLSAKSSEKEPLRIGTSIPSLPSPEHRRKRPGPLNLQTTITSSNPPALPSTLATARYIEDINRITYPEGIKGPNVELNVNTQRGKFLCVLSAIDIPFGLNNFTF